MTVRTTIAGLPDLVGRSLGETAPLLVDQQRIDRFAAATDDHQWIHVDPERAASGPFGATVAHGYLTLALVPRLSSELFRFADVERALNYGIEKVRFPSAVHPGDRVRARATIRSVEPHPLGVLARVSYTIEIEHRARPACVLEALMIVVPLPAAALSEAGR